MKLDWHRLKAVVLESDDWGLCAWVPDDAAHRSLAALPAFESVPGRRYGRSTLESAADVRALAGLLREFRGADGQPPVWQANTIVAAPDWSRLSPPFADDALPVTGLDALPSRWQRPGLLEAYADADAAGVWWAELHGLHHLPETALLRALRHGEPDARAACEQQSPLCVAVEAGGEYDPSEPRQTRARILREAIARFTVLFGRAPTSFCPPDYRFDAWLESEAESLGLLILQGKAEQGGRLRGWLRRRGLGPRFPHRAGGRFHLPPRIAFEPRGESSAGGRVGVDAAHRRAREAWGRGEPAVISTHRLNFAHLDAPWSAAGRAALRELLGRLCADGAVFLTDAEVRSLDGRGWSERVQGGRRTLLRHLGPAREPLQFLVPAGAAGARLSPPGAGEVKLGGPMAEARVDPGVHVIEWMPA